MADSIFSAYDQEFSSIAKEIQRNINELKSANSDKSQSLIRLIEGLISQANDLIKQMNVEVRSQDAATRKVLSEKVTLYVRSLASYKADFERAKEISQRSALVGERSANDRQRLLDTNTKLDRQNELILNATRTVEETREIGIEITSELVRNREKIENSRSKAREFSGLTDTARRVLNSMQNRDVRQKYMIAFLALVMIIAIIIIAVYSSNTTTSSTSTSTS